MLFGSKKRIYELEAENQNLKTLIEKFNGLEAVEISKMIAASQAELVILAEQVETAKSDLAQARQQIIETDDIALLQEVGIYQYRHPLDDAVAYQGQLKENKAGIKALVKNGKAVETAQGWTVNNSKKEGAKMTRDLSKLMLRAYNSEADNIARTLRPHSLISAISRLDKARETIARLGKIVQLKVTDQYHSLRVYELELTADYLVKVEEDKERQRQERARQREEEKAIREMEVEKRRLEKERTHYQTALEKLREKGDEVAVAEMEAKVAEIESNITGINNREANIRAGYVYVISNFGSFGQHVVKIGLTRRLEPMDRVRELSDASVPFNFDVHALIFSDDAVGLEKQLHESFEEKRVNLVNLRREFFYVTPEEVQNALQNFGSQQLLEFKQFPEASEWRASGGPQRASQILLEPEVTFTD